jgi:hypothetical protein
VAHPTFCSKGIGIPFLKVKLPEHEALKSSPYIVDVNNEWSYAATLSYIITA